MPLKGTVLELNTIAKIEAGEDPNPIVDVLKKLAKALGVPTVELFK